MALDYLRVISDEASRIVAAYEQDASAAVPWSDRWSVGTVARHVAGTHHVVAEIVRGRPDADFGLFASLESPEKGAPEFVDWFRSGTDNLIAQLSSVAPEEECWSWYPEGRQVGWWARRMAFEAVVHRFDTDAAIQQEFEVSSDVAADGVDEYLDVFVAASRAGQSAPAGPVIGFECTDQDRGWSLDLTVAGQRTVSHDLGDVAVQVGGSAQQLLLAVWGRTPITSESGLECSGDVDVLARWSELVPPM